MKNKKIVWSFVIILVCLIVGFSAMKYYLNHNVGYQLKKLENGNTSQKIKAISFLSDKKILSIIPILMDNIDNQNRAYWREDPKGGLTTISCVATVELGTLTGYKLGNTCYETDASELEIKQKWPNWYKNKYPQWLKEHQQN